MRFRGGVTAEFCASAVSAVSAGWALWVADWCEIGELVGLFSSTTVCNFFVIESNNSDDSKKTVEVAE